MCLSGDQLVQEHDGLRQQAQQHQTSLAELEQQQNAFYAEAIERFRLPR